MSVAGLRLRDPFWFYFPLIFTAELMMISHSVIHAFLARVGDPTLVLAAFSISFIVHSVMGSPLWVGPQISIYYASNKRAVVRLFFFHLQVAMPPTVIMLVCAWSPLGTWVYAGLMGASAEVVSQAKEATAYFVLVFYSVPARNIATGLIMRNRRTALITVGTFVRLLSLGGFLSVLPLWFSGATVGALALWGCISVEAIFATFFALPFYRALPATDPAAEVSYRRMWGFSWPLMVNQAAESAVFLVINFFLGRLANADLALAAFGVMRGIQMVLLSSLRNLAQTAQTLVRSREDLAIMLRFSFCTIGGMAVLVLVLFVTPAGDWVLYEVMGLTPALGDYIIMPLTVTSSLVAISWGYSALLRGLITGVGRTGRLAATGVVRLAVVFVLGCLTLLLPHINGALVGALAFAGAFAVEVLVLGWQLFYAPQARGYFFSQAKS